MCVYVCMSLCVTMCVYVCMSVCAYVCVCVCACRLKYIMLLILPIILSRNPYPLFPKLFSTFYYKSMQICYKNHA